MGITKEIKKELNKINNVIAVIEKGQIENDNNDRLSCQISNNCFQYRINNKYVKKEERYKAVHLAQTEYERRLLLVLKNTKKKLENLLAIYTKDSFGKEYTNMCEGRKLLVTPYFPDKEKYIERWCTQEYDHWEIKDTDSESENKYAERGKIFTLKGERVRSKSEKIIADELTRYDIPYRYEYPMTVRIDGAVSTIRPDFVTLNKRTLQEYIVEHLGMMDNKEYFERTLRKLDIYEKNGYLIGKNLIILHETTYYPLDMQIVDRYIWEYML